MDAACIVFMKNVQAVGMGDCDCYYRAGELAPIRSENRGKEEGTSRAEPLGIHRGAHLINPPGPSPFANKTSCLLLLFETRRLRVPSSCLFVFMTQSQSRSQPGSEQNSPSHNSIVGIVSFGLLRNTTNCLNPAAVCSLCSGLPCLGSYCSQSLGPRNRRPPSLSTSTQTVQLPGWQLFRPYPASSEPHRSWVPSQSGTP